MGTRGLVSPFACSRLPFPAAMIRHFIFQPGDVPCAVETERRLGSRLRNHFRRLAEPELRVARSERRHQLRHVLAAFHAPAADSTIFASSVASSMESQPRPSPLSPSNPPLKKAASRNISSARFSSARTSAMTGCRLEAAQLPLRLVPEIFDPVDGGPLVTNPLRLGDPHQGGRPRHPGPHRCDSRPCRRCC